MGSRAASSVRHRMYITGWSVIMMVVICCIVMDAHSNHVMITVIKVTMIS
jgi:hypothetical protein